MSELHLSKRHPDDPLISVVVISYNFERYLVECLDSVLQQTLRPFEIIVCDDCSTDGSWDLISTYAARYRELIVTWRQPINLGHIANGTIARSKVRGELLSVIDGDDYWRADKREQEWHALRANPEARTAYSNVFTIDSEGAQTGSGTMERRRRRRAETSSRQRCRDSSLPQQGAATAMNCITPMPCAQPGASPRTIPCTPIGI